MKKIKKQAGVTLIEVLVTLVILSVAMTGIAAMQVTSMQSASQIKYRSAAMSTAQSVLDAMRANRTGSGATASLASLKRYVGSNASKPAGPSQENRDYLAFEAELDASLNNRTPKFSITVGDDRLVTVTINWSQRNEKTDGSTEKTYSVSAFL